MKFVRLDIEGFAGLVEAQIPFGDVTWFLGGNGQGKSTVLHALTWLYTGMCPQRELTTKKAAKEMLCSSKRMLVRLHTDGGVYERKATADNITLSKDDLAAMQVALDAAQLIHASPAARQALFAKLLPKTQSSNVRVLLQQHGYTEENILKLAEEDIGGCYDWAFEQRKIVKRTLKSLAAVAEPDEPMPSVVEIGGKMVDLEQYANNQALGQVRSLLADAEQALAQAGQQVAAAEAVDKEKAAKVIEAAEDMAKQCDPAALADATLQCRRELAKLKQTREGAQEKAAKLRGQLAMEQRRDTMLGADGAMAKCPTCKAPMVEAGWQAAKDDCAKQIEELTGAYNKQAAALQSASYRESEGEGALQKAQAAEQGGVGELAMAERQMATMQEALELANTLPALQEEVAKLEKRRDSYRALAEAAMAYVAYRNERQGAREESEKVRAEVDRMEQLVALVAPDGEVRKQVNEATKGIMWDEELAEAWGLGSLTLQPDGRVTLQGRPLGSAATSEQYRAAVLLTEFLSRAAGLGVLVLDGLEVLEPDNRAHLSVALERWRETFATIICAQTTGSKPQPRDGSTLYWVTGCREGNGKVELIT